MKNIRLVLVASAFALTLAGCANGTDAKGSRNDSVNTLTDTITDITNPGVGSASDDTTARP